MIASMLPFWNNITGLTADSRAVKPGFLFAALPGTHVDGRAYIAEAINKGAIAILAPEGTVLPAGSGNKVDLVTNQLPKQYFSLLAAKFYKKQPQHIVAVTGTNGKTSVAFFCQQLWKLLGLNSASMGTLGLIKTGDSDIDQTSLTTPDPVMLHKTLNQLAENDIQYLAIEASSHGLDQYRLDGVAIQAAGFTNLSRDHLDYHRNIDEYFAAKKRLFSDILPKKATAIINADIPESTALYTLCKSRGQHIIEYGKEGRGLHVKNIANEGFNIIVSLSYAEKNYDIRLSLIGDFQIENVLCALGLVHASGISMESLFPLTEKLVAPPGRMENVSINDNKMIIVDYAHTPDALEKALQVLRPYTKGKLYIVFGCGGDRDKGKRSLMGAIANQFADEVIVTDDNPRFEDAATIRKEILVSCKDAKNIHDREEAITFAVQQMQPGDIVLIAGKGHEKGQVIGGKVLPFDDKMVAIKAQQPS